MQARSQRAISPSRILLHGNRTVEPAEAADADTAPTTKRDDRSNGPPQTVFSWAKDRCEDLDIPDLPARAFRDAQGRVQLIAAHYINRRFIGT